MNCNKSFESNIDLKENIANYFYLSNFLSLLYSTTILLLSFFLHTVLVVYIAPFTHSIMTKINHFPVYCLIMFWYKPNRRRSVYNLCHCYFIVGSKCFLKSLQFVYGNKIWLFSLHNVLKVVVLIFHANCHDHNLIVEVSSWSKSSWHQP